MTRQLLKAGLAGVLGWSGAAAVYRRLPTPDRPPLVLGYHRVVENFAAAAATSIDAMLVSTSTLEKQVEWLCRHFDVFGLDEIHAVRRRRRNGKPPAAITFDDGYADVYHNAFPLLLRKGVPFAVFVVSDRIGARELYVHDELYLLLDSVLRRPGGAEHVLRLIGGLAPGGTGPRPCAAVLDDPFRLTRRLLENCPMASLRALLSSLRETEGVPDAAVEAMLPADWAMLHDMRAAGVVIGCHSRSHPLFTNERRQTLVAETAGARDALEQGLGESVVHFAYPDGAYNAAAVDAVALAGFRYGYGTCLHSDPAAPHLTLPRRLLWERSSVNPLGSFSPSLMDCQTSGVFDLFSRCRALHG